MKNISKVDFDSLIESWLGCDGGNRKANIWICGIEYGGGFDDIKELITKESSKRIEDRFWDNEFRERHPNYSAWPYHQKVAKFMLAVSQSHDELRISVENYKDYMREKLYTENGDSFKLNLFPFSSPSVSDPRWKENYQTICTNRDEYYDRCRRKRFTKFSNLRKEHRPKVIIGTGITHNNYFLEAFGFRQDHEYKMWELSHNRRCRIYEDDLGVLVVSPFFGGRYGMNRDGLLIELAKQVAPLLRMGLYEQ